MQVLEKILEEIDREIYKQREICNEVLDTPGYRLYEKTMNVAKEIVKRYMDDAKDKNIHSNDDWIPVEERLPDIDTEVIITDRDGNVYTDVTYGFAEESDEEPSFNEWTPDMWQNYKYDAIAWMKTPEPYRTE